jgi:phosphoserine/homoserine phosphotransferase
LSKSQEEEDAYIKQENLMDVACLDLEGVLVPEIWINVALATGIDKLKATTRDVADYDVLMRQRLEILQKHKLGLSDIQAVIDNMGPLEGAKDFLSWLRQRFQVIVVSDTFYQFAAPLMRQLGYPTLFCNKLVVDENGNICDYKLRQKDQKRQAVIALHQLKYKVIAVGDSFNDISMLSEADAGILYRPPESVRQQFAQFPVTNNYEELKAEFVKASSRL